MKNPLRLGLLALCVVLVPGTLSLYKHRWWPAAAYLASLAYLLIFAFGIQHAVHSTETLFVAAVSLAGAHFVALSARLVMSAERHVRAKSTKPASTAAQNHIPTCSPIRNNPPSLSMPANNVKSDRCA